MTYDDNFKTCLRCGKEKPHTDFGRQTRNCDGRDTYCLQCRRTAYRDAHGGISRLLAKFTTEELEEEISRRRNNNL